MPNSIPSGYEYHVVAPAEQPGLTCRFLKPLDFTIAELPPATPDFSQGAQFLPLAIALTQFGPLVFTVAARPAFSDGTVSDWLAYLCSQEGYPHGPITPTRIGDLPAVTCDATQTADGAVMKMRFVLLEDDGRLFQMAAMGPESLWASAIEKLAPMLASLELREMRGTKVALHPGDPLPVAAPTAVAPPTARLTAEELAALALGADASSLDPEHPMNARLRDNGAGLVPRVANVDLPGRSVTLAAGAVEGFFRVPLGWHVIDDGRRTLVFDAGGKIQVNLSQRLAEGSTPGDFARACLDQYLATQPELSVATITLDGIAGAGLRGVRIEAETLDQYFLVRDVDRSGRYLVARVTAGEADATRALNLAGDILATFEGPPSAAR